MLTQIACPDYAQVKFCLCLQTSVETPPGPSPGRQKGLVGRSPHQLPPERLHTKACQVQWQPSCAQLFSNGALTEASVHKVVERMTVTCECELAVVSGTLLKTLDCHGAEVSSIRSVVGQHCSAARHKGID